MISSAYGTSQINIWVGLWSADIELVSKLVGLRRILSRIVRSSPPSRRRGQVRGSDSAW